MRPAYPIWSRRSPDYGNLFNPAFLMLVLGAACRGFEAEQKDLADVHDLGMPFALLFLAAPLALSSDFKNARPRRVMGSLTSWSRKHAAITASVSSAAYSLVPAVREALVFGLRAEQLQAASGGRIRQGVVPGALELDVRVDLLDHLDSAVFTGRWLAKSGTTASILEAFGLRP